MAPVFTLQVAAEEYLTNSKHTLLNRARQAGKRHTCLIEMKVERHDDDALVRQKLRLYAETRRAIAKAGRELQRDRRCAGLAPEDCLKVAGAPGDAAREYLTNRSVLSGRLEPVPFYRIGTLYLFPQRNQCVTAQLDWYLSNTEYPANEAIFPLEAREEMEVILKNLEQLKLSP